MQYDGGNTCGGAGEVYENVSPTYAGNEDQNMVTVRATSEHPKFISSKYKSVFRGSKLAKDSQGRYINPFKQVRTLSNGRRFMYDDTHPDMIYGSQFSPELVDVPNIYSYTSLNHLTPEIPWDKTISWKVFLTKLNKLPHGLLVKTASRHGNTNSNTYAGHLQQLHVKFKYFLIIS